MNGTAYGDILLRAEYLVGLTEGTLTGGQRESMRECVESGEMEQPLLVCNIINIYKEKVYRSSIPASDAADELADELNTLGITYIDVDAEKENLALLLSLCCAENDTLTPHQKILKLEGMISSGANSKLRAAYLLIALQSYLDQNDSFDMEKVKELNACLRGCDVTDDDLRVCTGIIRSALLGGEGES